MNAKSTIKAHQSPKRRLKLYEITHDKGSFPQVVNVIADEAGLHDEGHLILHNDNEVVAMFKEWVFFKIVDYVDEEELNEPTDIL